MANMVTYPLNKIDYQATDAELFHCTRNSGVYSGDDFSMSVTGANNIVTIAPGVAWIRNGRFTGKVFASKENVGLDFGIADTALPRWDVACIQFDKNNNATDIVVKKGVAASSPTIPAITQAETLYELYLCKVYRPAGSVAITADNVYDTRLDKAVCGLMADSVTSVDTSAINAQVTELIEKLRAEINDIQSGTGVMTKSVYDADNDGIVDHAKQAENADKATTAETATSADNGIHTYTHTKSGTVHNLTGPELKETIGKETIGNIKFMAVANWNPGDTLTVNGVEARCYNSLVERVEDDVLFKNYARVELTVAYTVGGYYTCFFKSGGGVPDGLTALPVNNVLIWQRCAGLKTSYTTAAQVLADTATLKALINSANAMEYLIRSTTIQAAVLANANAVSILDKSMPVITPSMKSTSSPYGTVTKADGHFNTGVYKAFNYTEIGTNNSDGSAYSGQPGGWVQYNFSGDRPVWLYKSQIRPTYVNSGVVMRMQGVLADGTVVRLSDDFSVGALGNGYNATPTPIIHKANSYKCVAVRFYVYSGGTIYFNGGKVWGK